MNPSLADLLMDLERSVSGGDLDQVASIRRTIASSHATTEDGAEAMYKLGLDALFRRADLEASSQHLRESAKAKSPRWSPLARSTLGLILLRMGKPQQALFELRKVAGLSPPTLVSAQAWGLLVMAHRALDQAGEAERARGEHLKTLLRLTETAPAEDRGLAQFLLGMEYKFEGRRDLAKRFLRLASEDAELPEPYRSQTLSALKEV